MIRPLALVGLMGIGSSAIAEDPPKPIDPSTLVGASAFNWAYGPGQCKKVDAAMIKQWSACMPPDGGSASGKPMMAVCKPKKGRAEYVVFKEAADCKEERDTQIANKEGA
jgi:hypothetical protein